MNTANGIVKKIQQRGKAFNFVLIENGQEVWYGHGFAPPKFNEGDSITFTWQANGNFKNVDLRSVQVSAAPAPAQQQTSGSSPAPAKAGGYASNQLAIQYQASRNSAIEALKVAAAHGISVIPSNAKKGDQLDMFMKLVDDITIQYHAATDKVVANGGIVLEEMEHAVVTPDNF